MSAMRVELSAHGNPDCGQPWDLGILRLWVLVPGYAQASAVCRRWLDANGYGAGNWDGGRVRRGRNVVARVGYNGRVWEGDRCVYEPVRTIP